MTNCRLKRSIALVTVLGTASVASADTFYPMLMKLHPVAIQVGKTSETEVFARYDLDGAYKVFVSGEQVTGEPVLPEVKKDAPVPKPKPVVGNIKLKFTAAPEALPGVRDFRVATPLGASTVGQLVVVRDPVIVEKADNDAIAGAQSVTLPAALCGVLEKNEDVDYYKFTVAAGASLTFRVHSNRLQNRMHDLQVHSDPILTLRNASGTVLAANDNYYAGDPLLNYKFAAAGEYYLEIRDVRYQGDANWTYCIEASDRPYVTNVFPPRITPGAPAKVQLVGHNLPADPVLSLSLPPTEPEATRWVTLPLPTPAPAEVVVSKLAEAVEAAGDNNTFDKAQVVPMPSGISGRIEAEGDVDCFAVDLKQNDKMSVEVLARRIDSSLDPNIRLLNAKGERILENDDNSFGRFLHADSMFENWTAPADGRYIIEIRDLHQRGGAPFVYFLKVTRSEPHFLLEIDTDKTCVAPGINGVIYVRATRKNGFAGEVQLQIEGLPPGVTATCGRILASGIDGCIILHCAPNAAKGASNIKITGTATHPLDGGKTLALATVGVPLQELYFPGGGRGNYPVEMHTVSVGDPLDIRSVKITPNAISLKPGESKKVEIVVERAPEFKGNITVEPFYQHLGAIYGNSLPAGVTVDDKNSQSLLTGEVSKGYLTFTAAADAKPVADQIVPLMAHVSINFVMKFTYSSEPLKMTILAP